MSLVGKPAPSITLPDANGESYTLTPGQGKVTVVFFYPKSGSIGCTKEVCQFRDAIAEKPMFNPATVQVVGISGDPVAKQKAFVEKNQVNYPILSDEQGEARKAYGVTKGLMGLSEARVTFVIDAKGVVRDQFESVLNYAAHSKFVTKWLAKLEQERTAEPEAAVAPLASATDAPATDVPATEAPATAPTGKFAAEPISEAAAEAAPETEVRQITAL